MFLSDAGDRMRQSLSNEGFYMCEVNKVVCLNMYVHAFCSCSLLSIAYIIDFYMLFAQV